MKTENVSRKLLLHTVEQALRNLHIRHETEHGNEATDALDRARVARWVCSAEFLGLGSFGVHMLVRELNRLAGLSDTHAGATPSDWAIDARNTPGQLALAAGVRRLVDQAGTSGLTGVSLSNVGALGVLGLAVRDIAEQGYVGIACANAPKMVAPWGGTQPAIGTNPIAIAAPRSDNPPLVIDYATSPITMAALRTAALHSVEVPPPGGFTVHGEPTRVAADIATIAPESRISSIVGLSVEMFGRAVGGSSRASKPGTRTAFLIAVNPDFFGTENLSHEMSTLGAEWSGAGGHLPARFDRLEQQADDIEFSLAEEDWQALQGFAESSRNERSAH